MVAETNYLYNILAFLVAAVGVVFLFRRMKASPMLGYLAAGMLVGPHVLKVVKESSETQFLGEIGVLFLLFTIGLELPLQRLQSLKNYVFGLGISQVLLTGGVFTFIALWAGLSKEAAILVGGALALSSTAVVLQVLTDRRELSTRFGRVSFSVLLLQDLAVVFLLILTTTFGTQGANIFVELFYAIVKAIAVLLIIIGLGRLVFRPLYRAVALSGSPELFMATTFLVILGTAFLTEISGLSRELGAFLAGILLAETEYRHQIEADIQPFRGLLLGVFFMSVGMSINLGVFVNSFSKVLGILFFVIALKVLLTFLLSRISGLKTSTSLRVSLLLAGGGEFIFVIFSPSVAQEFLPYGFTEILFLVVILSMALTPFFAMLGKWCSDRFQIHEIHADPHLETEEVREFFNHIIIAGFGRVGQMLGEILASRMIPFVAIDTDMRRVTEGREKGYPVFYGDARRHEILKAVGAESAKAVVITLNQMTPSVRAVMMLRRRFPDVPICVRIKDHKHQEKLIESGARLVVPETVEPTVQLAISVLRVMGVPSDEINQLIDTFRRQHWIVSDV
ncbi:MAG: monovalent cation:proton antiporter-2 (CPA2) family protein [Alphaproteobacteria bacterium]|nr:monovalent cation:proton antiporter-2 (CPA2) family protein [Alphaproteobacteria bacterium]